MDNKKQSNDHVGNEYVNFRKELQDQLEKINNNVSSLVKDGTSGICNRVKNLLTTMSVKDTVVETYSIEQLPTHESESSQNEDDEESNNGEDVAQFSKIEDIETQRKKDQNEAKIRHIAPFITVVNGDDSGETKYKEMHHDVSSRRKNISLVALDKKIEKRNDFLNKFGKAYTITNLS